MTSLLYRQFDTTRKNKAKFAFPSEYGEMHVCPDSPFGNLSIAAHSMVVLH